MALSDLMHRPAVLDALNACCQLTEVKHVVDVGAGLGGWREFLRPWTPAARWTAVEVHAPYVQRFLLTHRYDMVITADVRKIPLPRADIYLLGDVIEHMPAADAKVLWAGVLRACRWAVVCLPVVWYPQDAVDGNPYEAHVETWPQKRVITELAPCKPVSVSAMTGAFLARGCL